MSEEWETLQTYEELSKNEKKTSADTSHPTHLPLNKIKQCPKLFQPRNESLTEYHAQDLARALKSRDELDPIKVIFLNDQYYVIDGHHRLEAYRLAKKTKSIPIDIFKGSVKEAVLSSGLSNSKCKLTMRNEERQNFDWKLTKLKKHYKKEIVEASGISDGQIAKMRRVFKELEAEAFTYDIWWKALKAYQGKGIEPEEETNIEVWLDNQAEKYQLRMNKAFGMKLVDNPKLAARTLIKHFGRRLPAVLSHIHEYGR